MIQSDVADYLRNEGLISHPRRPPDQWHLVSIRRGITSSKPADAQLLTKPLNFFAVEGFWKTWSENHPAQAATLWPLVQRLASLELYVVIPKLLDLAYRSADADDFQARLDQLVRFEMAGLIVDLRQSGRKDFAAELLQEAISVYPDDEVLKTLNSIPQ